MGVDAPMTGPVHWKDRLPPWLERFAPLGADRDDSPDMHLDKAMFILIAGAALQ